ncbi:LLM class flavin-dependent oxidoreductase [Nocardiopsis quinghaiensis]|uniref:LLM class flavin-dependent oxidoreductase n=1 Tax=Nocardiopsis quinghaiensis TaxID=464995 RepID=UPI00123C3B2E|nr:LLM class flavin-dependent oxidoreductase [Nocardiopsis quinghaiensis]
MSTNSAGVMGSRGRVRIGLVDLFDGSEKRNLDFMTEFARTAEASGFDGIWMPEHVLFFDEYDSVYPYPEAPIAANPDVKEQHNKVVDGKAEVESAPEQGLLDMFQTAVAVCAATTRLRFGSSVLLLPLRNPRLLAREALTVAELTGDRFDLGVGVGWSAEEFEACESDFTVRGKRCERLINDLKTAWSGDRGKRSSLPAGTTPPRVLIGGHSRAAVRRAGTVADGWYPWNLTPAEFEEGLEALDRHLATAGRSRDDVHVIAGFRAVGEIADLSRIVARYAELGVDGVNISLRMTEDNYAHVMSEVADALELTGSDA